MQGRLTGKEVEVEVETGCAHCDRKLRLTFDQDLRSLVWPEGVEPLVFEPSVDWSRFTKPHIIDDF